MAMIVPAAPHLSPLTPEDLRRLSLDRNNVLYCDGVPIVAEQRVVLSSWQKIALLLISFAALMVGAASAIQVVSGGRDFGCRMGWLPAAVCRTADERPTGT